MRVSLEWLAEWVDLPAPELLAERLTLGGLEVEAEEKSGPDLSARLTGPQGSGLVSGLGRAGGLAVIPEETDVVEAGGELSVLLIGQ